MVIDGGKGHYDLAKEILETKGLNEMEHKGLSSSLIQGMVASFNKINTIKDEQI